MRSSAVRRWVLVGAVVSSALALAACRPSSPGPVFTEPPPPPPVTTLGQFKAVLINGGGLGRRRREQRARAGGVPPVFTRAGLYRAATAPAGDHPRAVQGRAHQRRRPAEG